MRKLVILGNSILIALLLTACSLDMQDAGSQNSPTKKPNLFESTISTSSPSLSRNPGDEEALKRKQVNWTNFRPELQLEIDKATAEGNCKLIYEIESGLNSTDNALKDYFEQAKSIAFCNR